MDRQRLAEVIEGAIDALPMERRLYPDTYADIVADAVIEEMGSDGAL